MPSSLKGLKILDLSRVLAGPFCTQILGDLGADIIKVERPNEGDDTRKWGPPYLKDKDGNDTTESAYYLSCNRNKRSLTIDITKPEGQALIKKLAAESDVLIENFKVGGLDKYGLGHEALRKEFPRLIYCAISGFGQTGPLAPEAGYDLMSQAMGGFMAHTGVPDGDPMKAGVAIVDVMTGLYAAIGILAALHAREQTGQGDLVDVALLDVTLSAMTNLAQYYLTSGTPPARFGNAHATIVPYQAFAAQDGHFVIAVGNDSQFKKFCALLGQPDWANDPRFAHNSTRVQHRETLVPLLSKILLRKTVADWVELFEAEGIPAGPVNRLDDVFAMDQIAARDMKITMPHPLSPTPISLVGSPLKLSTHPVDYTRPPPIAGQHTDEILTEILGLSPAEIEALRAKGVL